MSTSDGSGAPSSTPQEILYSTVPEILTTPENLLTLESPITRVISLRTSNNSMSEMVMVMCSNGCSLFRKGVNGAPGGIWTRDLQLTKLSQ